MFRVSLRMLLIFVAIMALAIVSLRYASVGWQMLVWTLTLVAFVAEAIVAVVDRGPRQAFAIGFTIALLVYGIVLMLAAPLDAPLSHNPEFNPAVGRLLTTRLLHPLYAAVADVRWYNLQSGLLVPNDNSGLSGGESGSANITLSEWPDRGVFASIGHLWWAFLFGCCGGWFARRVYLRRNSGSELLASRRS